MAKTRKQQIEEMLGNDPNDPFLHYGLAMEHLAEGDDEGAVTRFRHLVAIAPDYVPAYLQLGQTLLRLHRAEEARKAIKDGAVQAQKQGDAHAWEEMQGLLAGLE